MISAVVVTNPGDSFFAMNMFCVEAQQNGLVSERDSGEGHGIKLSWGQNPPSYRKPMLTPAQAAVTSSLSFCLFSP